MKIEWKRLVSFLMLFVLVFTMIPAIYAEESESITAITAATEMEPAESSAETEEPPEQPPSEQKETEPPPTTDPTDTLTVTNAEAGIMSVAEDEGIMLASTNRISNVTLFDLASPYNYTIMLPSQVTVKYKPNGTDSAKTAYLKNIAWHYYSYGGTAYRDDPIYCIEPHKNFAASTPGNYIEQGADVYGSSSGSTGSNIWYNMPTSYRSAIAYILQYSAMRWDHSVSAASVSKSNNPNFPLRTATQVLIYEIVMGLRDADSFVLNGDNGYVDGDILYNAFVNQVSGFSSSYHALVSDVQSAALIPSFTSASRSSAPTIELEGVLTWVYDNNEVMPNFTFTDDDSVIFNCYTNDLCIEKIGTVNSSKVYSCYRTRPSTGSATFNIFYPATSSYQTCVNLLSPATSYTYGYFKLKAEEPGTLAIKKTTEDGLNLSGWKFGVYTNSACTSLAYGPYTTNTSGSITVGSVTPGTYYVKELGHTDSATNAKYQCASTNPQKVTVSNGSTTTVNFKNNLILGYVKIVKNTNTGLNRSGWKFNIYTDAGRTNLVSGSPFTSSADGTITVSLKPGTYYVKEVNESSTKPDWTFDDSVRVVTVTAGNTGTVNFENTHYGYANIIKQTNTGKNLNGWKFNIYTDSGCTSLLSGSPFTTGADGTITAKVLPGTYYVKEYVATPQADWDYDTEIREITVTGGSTAGVTFTNCHYGYAKIIKETSTGEKLDGWKFNIYADETCTTLMEGSPFVSGEDGTITTRIPAGTYYVQEVDESNTNPEWIYDTTLKEITVEGGKTASVSFTNTQRGYALIQKQTNTGKNLGGWKFHIYTDRACTQMVTGSPFMTGEDGIAKTLLVPGTYYVRELDESKDKPDWAFDDTVYEVTVETGKTATITATNEQMGRVKVIKTMPDGGSAAGWTFDIHTADGKTLLGTFVSGADGTILTDYMLPSEVLITEQTPEDSPYICEGDNPKKVTIEAGKTAEVTFTNRLKTAQIVIQKTDITGAPLAGAEFLLEWSKDGKSWTPVVRAASEGVAEGTCGSAGISDGKLTSDESGLVTFTRLHPDSYYRLTETKAPDGYQLLAEAAFEGQISDDDLKLEFTVVNVRTFQLPETGSKSLILTAISLTLAAGLCAALLMEAKRREKRK